MGSGTLWKPFTWQSSTKIVYHNEISFVFTEKCGILNMWRIIQRSDEVPKKTINEIKSGFTVATEICFTLSDSQAKTIPEVIGKLKINNRYKNSNRRTKTQYM